MQATVMRWNRTKAEVPRQFMVQFGHTLGFVQAADGVWVPKGDKVQYEAGRRPWADPEKLMVSQ